MAQQGTIGYGRRVRMRKDRWAVFDALPADVRRAYANAAFDWAIVPGMTASRIVNGDRVKIAEDRTRVWNWSKTEAALADLGLDD